METIANEPVTWLQLFIFIDVIIVLGIISFYAGKWHAKRKIKKQ